MKRLQAGNLAAMISTEIKRLLAPASSIGQRPIAMIGALSHVDSRMAKADRHEIYARGLTARD